MLSLIIFLPLVGGIIILFTSKTNETLLKGIALGASLASFVLSLFMTALFKIGGGFQFLELGNWIPSLGIHYHLGVDGLSLPLIVLTALLSLLSVAYSWRIELRLTDYLFLFLLLETGVLGVLPQLRDQGADVALSHLVTRRARGGADGRERHPGRRASEDGDVRVRAGEFAHVARGVLHLRAGGGRAGPAGDRVRRARGHGPD